MNNIQLLMIDPQNDFCIPTGPSGEKGQLVVPGAADDMVRLAAFIRKNQSRLTEIHCTVDSHQSAHIAHPLFWMDAKGNHPPFFTTISDTDTANGVWMTYNPRLRKYGEHYTAELKKHGRYELTIWPPHCIIGSWGHSIVPDVSKALIEWEQEAWKRLTKVDYVAKGSNVLTEHYSGVMADVPDDGDTTTKLNTGLIETIKEADLIPIMGEALSHCVRYTVTDIANNFGDENIKKFVLLEDACSNVTGCDDKGRAFVKEMVARGMKVSNTKDF